MISYDLNKNEVKIFCPNEKKETKISIEDFFGSLEKLKKINICENCVKDSNIETKIKKIYICNSCSNKKLCKKCFENHNLKHDINKIDKYDSTCQKHLSQYYGYCSDCKENICMFCQDENHKNHSIILLSKILIPKNQLENLKNNIQNSQKIRSDIEEKINNLIKELKEKEEQLKSLMEKFTKLLDVKIKFIEIFLHNYENKIEEIDLNYQTIFNLQKEINFKVPNLSFYENEKLAQKIEKSFDFFEKNKNFNNYLNNLNYKVEDNDNKLKELSIVKTKKNLIINGFTEVNKDCIAFASNSKICLYDNNFNELFTIKEFKDNIYKLGKIEDNKIIGISQNSIIVFNIINNNDYIIENSFKSPSNKLFYFNNYIFYYNYGRFYYKNYPYYQNFNLSFVTNHDYLNLNFLDNISFFAIDSYILDYYIYSNNTYYKISSTSNIKLNANSSIFEVNQKYYAINYLNIIYLLNKEKLNLVKTIDLNIRCEYSFFFNEDKNKFTLFHCLSNSYNSFNALSLNVLNDGIKWEEGKNNFIKEGTCSFIQKYNGFYFICLNREFIIMTSKQKK